MSVWNDGQEIKFPGKGSGECWLEDIVFHELSRVDFSIKNKKQSYCFVWEPIFPDSFDIFV